MSLGGLEIGAITRSQDFTQIKQNEDMKPEVQQSLTTQKMEEQADQRTHEVVDSDAANWHEKGMDAKEKGDNEYNGDGGRGRNKKHNPHDTDRVIVKGRQSFDLKI